MKIKKKSAAGWRKQCNREPCTLYCYQILEQSCHGEQGQDMQHTWEIQHNNIQINLNKQGGHGIHLIQDFNQHCTIEKTVIKRQDPQNAGKS